MVDDAGSTAMRPWEFVAGSGEILTIVDHASNHVPAGIELGIDPPLMTTHIAWDIGAADLARALGFPAILATVSRLVIDFNREEASTSIIPVESDGVMIPGNPGDRLARVEQLWKPYHAEIAGTIRAMRPKMLLSVHSFTPSLTTRPFERRPWEIGVLYNEDDRAAGVALSMLAKKGVVVGDQQPYSGTTVNATMNRHGEANGIPYLGIEVRHDLISDSEGISRWADVLRPVVNACLDHFDARGTESV